MKKEVFDRVSTEMQEAVKRMQICLEMLQLD